MEIRLTEADDLFFGTASDEKIIGDKGNDTIVGNDGADTLEGWNGNDILISHGSGGMLSGDRGDDFLEAEKTSYGQYHLYGSVGDDTFWMHLDNQSGWGDTGFHIYGGDGQDSFYFFGSGDANAPIVSRIDDFDASQDSIYFDGQEIDLRNLPDNMRIVLWDGQQWLQIDDNVLIGLEGARVDPNSPTGEDTHMPEFPTDLASLETTDFIDPMNYVPLEAYQSILPSLVVLDGERDSIVGTASGDYVYGGKMGSTLSMGGGNDVANAGKGMDTVFGGDGDDLIAGGSDGDVLKGETGADQIWGGTEDDVMDGGDGNDTLDGGTGSNTLTGGYGDDNYITAGGDLITEKIGEGTDTVQSSISYTLGANVENLVLTGTASINGTGNGLNNRLTGNSGNNLLTAGGGADTMFGGAGDDIYTTDGGETITEYAGQGVDMVRSSASYMLGANLENLVLTGFASISGTGNALANRLTGNSGANALNGGAGNDVLTGGGGLDTFIFNSALGTGNVDRITDFDVTADMIRLENAVFTGLAGGTLAATAFVRNMSGNAADASDRIIYESDTGNLYFDPDGTGAAAKIQFATLSPNLNLTNADLFVF